MTAEDPPSGFLFPLLQPGTRLHACLICGAVIAASGVGFHDDWHRDTSKAAIAVERRLHTLEGETDD